MGDTTYSVVLVSERTIYQTTLRALVDSTTLLNVVGVASGCLSALHMVQELNPDFVVMAASLPEPEVIMFLDSVRTLQVKTRVIVLSDIPRTRPNLMTAGASAVLSQDTSVTELLAALFTHT